MKRIASAGVTRRGSQLLGCSAAMCLFTASPVLREPQHFRTTSTKHPLYEKPKRAVHENESELAHQAHGIWTTDEVGAVKQTHVKIKGMTDAIAFAGVRFLRYAFDLVSGYKFGKITPNRAVRRILFLETAAGIPGMVAGALRHLTSLRRMRRDRGWIHTLLEEAENERVHMLTFMEIYQPGYFFRGLVLLTQGVFWNVYFLAYLISPTLCHRFVGYLEEEAVRTYTTILDKMDSNLPEYAELAEFGRRPATDLAKKYWALPATANMRDVILVVRADEANHRDVNHTFAGMDAADTCPFAVPDDSKPAGAPPVA